jgi:two-component system, NarL family, response regulator DevR
MARRRSRLDHRAMQDLVIVDDHPAVRSGLRGLLEDEEGLRVVATAATAREGFQAIADLKPQLALLDLHLPDDDGLSLCLRTRALPEPPRVVLYSAFADAGLGVRAAIAGASAVLAKSASPRALTAVLRGELRPALDPRALRTLGERLEPEQLAILGMLAHGVSEEEMAATLGLTPEKALTERQRMLARLSARRPLAAA